MPASAYVSVLSPTVPAVPACLVGLAVEVARPDTARLVVGPSPL